jgi:hypothetical protein
MATAEDVTIDDFLKNIKQHPWNRMCRICLVDVEKVAITKVFYRFEACACSLANYRHLVHTIYHEECWRQRTLAKAEQEKLEKEKQLNARGKTAQS